MQYPAGAEKFWGERKFSSAGPDQTAPTLSSVTLNGYGSFDPDGSPVAYRRKQIRGVPVTLSNQTAQNPAFIAPLVSGAQSADLLFMLTATGPSGLSSTAKCTVTVQYCLRPPLRPPDSLSRVRF